MELLALALNLAVLTYFIGVLIYALPIPLRSFKRWGARLIVDSITAATIIASYNLLLATGNTVLQALGYDWPSFYQWLTLRTSALVGTYVGFNYLGVFIKKTDYAFLTTPLNMAVTYITLALSALKVIYFLSSLVINFREELITLGVLLYSLPFRVGRGVGAFLIATSIIFYVGFPVMPAFVSHFQTPEASEEFLYEELTINGSVKDVAGNPLRYSLLALYSEESLDPLALIVTDGKGRFTLGDGLDILPEEFNYRVEIIHMGYVFTPIPANMSDGVDYVEFTVNTIYDMNGVALLLPPESVVFLRASSVDGRHTIELRVFEEGELPVVKLAKLSGVNLSVDGEPRVCVWNNFTWYSLSLSECSLHVPSGYVSITVEVPEYTYYMKPEVEEKRLVIPENLIDVVMMYLTTAIAYVYSLVFLPGVYVAMLSSMASALAKVLGGGLRIKLL